MHNMFSLFNHTLLYSFTIIVLAFVSLLLMCNPSNFDSWSLLMQLECINAKNIWTFLFSFVFHALHSTAQMQIYQVRRYCQDWNSSKKLFASFYLNQRSFLSYLTFRYKIDWSSVKPWIGLKRFTRIWIFNITIVDILFWSSDENDFGTEYSWDYKRLMV